jgi:hypothetical protein
VKKLALGFGLFVALIGSRAYAEVPAGYKGTPFKGTPATIPGRIDFENYDEGGQDVAWRVDDHTGNFGQGGCAANDYRMGTPHPQLCLTNNANEVDTYTMGPMLGQKYPSDAMPQSIYIGYTHGADWVKLTVNVSKAGMYKLSSTWGSEPGGADAIKFQISFNDMVKADVKLPGTGGYHNWVAYPDFATVTLDAGVQVLQFAPKSMHLNYDYLQFSLVLPGGGVDDGSMGVGGGGAGGAGSAGANAGGASTAGAGGAAAGGSNSGGSVGTAGFLGMDPPAPGGSTGTSGSTTGVSGTASSAGTGTGTTTTPSPNGIAAPQEDSSCSVALGHRNGSTAALILVGAMLGGVGLRRARRSRRVSSR